VLEGRPCKLIARCTSCIASEACRSEECCLQRALDSCEERNIRFPVNEGGEAISSGDGHDLQIDLRLGTTEIGQGLQYEKLECTGDG
jgi:hypothetical protein